MGKGTKSASRKLSNKKYKPMKRRISKNMRGRKK